MDEKVPVEIVHEIAEFLRKKFDIPFLDEQQECAVIEFIILKAIDLIPHRFLKKHQDKMTD